MPEGLKIYAQSVKAKLEAETDARCIICADPCYGACDYDLNFKQYADVLVQFGPCFHTLNECFLRCLIR